MDHKADGSSPFKRRMAFVAQQDRAYDEAIRLTVKSQGFKSLRYFGTVVERSKTSDNAP